MRSARTKTDSPDMAPKPRRGVGARAARFAGNFMRAKNVVGAETIRAGFESGVAAYEVAFADEASSGRRESFAEAVRRQGLTEADLLAAGARQRVIALTFGILACLVVLMAVVWILGGLWEGRFGPVFRGFGSLCIALLMGSFFIRSSFRLWQIRSRQLGGWEHFRRDWRLWIPRPVRPHRPGTGIALAGASAPPPAARTPRR